MTLAILVTVTRGIKARAVELLTTVVPVLGTKNSATFLLPNSIIYRPSTLIDHIDSTIDLFKALHVYAEIR